MLFYSLRFVPGTFPGKGLLAEATWDRRRERPPPGARSTDVSPFLQQVVGRLPPEAHAPDRKKAATALVATAAGC